MYAFLKGKGGEFRKSFGMVVSVLRSGNQDAYYFIATKMIAICLAPVNRALQFLETIFVQTMETSRDVPIVFVVGIQRSGTTLISQVIADAFPFFPVGNICSVFSRSSFFIHWMMKWCYFKKSRRYFTNYYGYSRGMWAVGDCYEVWDRWLGKDHYSVPATIPRKARRSIKRYFSNLEKIYRMPIIAKNNRNSLCLALLQNLFPNSFFIITRRDPIEVILSTLEGSRHFFGNKRMLWGLKPYQDFNEADYSNIIEAACFQQAYLEKEVEGQLGLVGEHNYHVIDYESFCEHPEKELRVLFDRLGKKMPLPMAGICFDYPAFTVQRASVNDNARGQVQKFYQHAVACVEEDTSRSHSG